MAGLERQSIQLGKNGLSHPPVKHQMRYNIQCQKLLLSDTGVNNTLLEGFSN